MADSQETLYKVDVVHEGNVLGEVSVAVARPNNFQAVAIMAHGAGGDMNAKLLVQLRDGLAARSAAVVRFNFLYSEKGKRAPDRRPLLEAAWRSVADWSRKELQSDAIFLGGKSMGGRMASYLAAASSFSATRFILRERPTSREGIACPEFLFPPFSYKARGTLSASPICFRGW